ncbi:peptide synthetase [Oleiphilus messinensis]|uniref:Peptide synthetase n=1 Tax=Oleiphilus messinensis TaxID=141451 RepID=A0A1Y0ICY8_9GAMM|nr:fatty acyl-CoA reductase [Oleiphilus messinensis]ARU58398.1 peptide synthetase [Oleiphilus messinensis]
MSSENQSITRAQLQGKNVLVTGTTGFVGKVLLEKLIREIPDIGGIYLLIRGNKKFPDAGNRFLHEIACASIFDSLKLENQDAFDGFCKAKIKCVTGEITEPNFGMARADFEALASEVDLIINSAASVNFREELDVALKINTLSLKNIIEFSRVNGEIPVLQVSTCYVNGFNKGDMHEENVAPAGRNIKQNSRGYFEVEPLISALQDKIASVKAKYTGAELKEKLVDLGIKEANDYGWNDTYTFTKWMGEQILFKELYGRSLTIVRPAIVESTLLSPVPGWIEGVKVADAIILAYAKEKVAFFPGKKDGKIDIIPADLVANGIILAAAELFYIPNRHKIYQVCSSGSNPVTLGEFRDSVQFVAQTNHKRFPKLFSRRPRSPFIFVNRTAFVATMQAAKLALQAKLKWQNRDGKIHSSKLLDNLDTGIKLSTVFSFYTAPNYVFHNDKLLDLAERMGPEDQATFPVDAGLIDWNDYVRHIHIPGLHTYALTERKLYTLKSKDAARTTKAA